MREEIDERREVWEPDGAVEVDETREVIDVPEPKRTDPTPILFGVLAFFMLAGLGAGVAINNEVQAQEVQLQRDAVVIHAQSHTIRALQAQQTREVQAVGNLQSEVAKLRADILREQNDPNF